MMAQPKQSSHNQPKRGREGWGGVKSIEREAFLCVGTLWNEQEMTKNLPKNGLRKSELKKTEREREREERGEAGV